MVKCSSSHQNWLPFIAIEAASILILVSFVGPVARQLVNIHIDGRQGTAAVTDGEWVRVFKWGSTCLPHDSQDSKELKKLLLMLLMQLWCSLLALFSNTRFTSLLLNTL